MLRASLVGLVIVAANLLVARADDDPLRELGERFLAQEKRYEDAVRKAQTDQERMEVFETLDPRNTLVEDFLAVEKSHRGQPAAISALYQLMRHAAGVARPDIPASEGRVNAIQILRDEYLAHPDLHLLLSYFTSGAYVPEAEVLLNDATKSPHKHVRAAAHFQLARFLAHKALLVEMFGPDAPPPDPTLEEHPLFVEFRRKLQLQLDRVPIDSAAERKKAVSLIDELVAEYPDVLQTFVKQEGSANLSIRRANSDEFRATPKTYAKLSESLRFELEHLQRGQVAPEISGKDADGIEFKLSDYRGRVVMLMFSANWCGPCKGMYPALRKLQATLDTEPFAILAVMGDQSIDSVIHDTEHGDIRWRTWFDGNSGPIAEAWNIQSWPSAFLIDHDGVIVHRQLGRSFEALKEAIDPLVAAQKADPGSQEQLTTHPLPELPILKRAK